LMLHGVPDVRPEGANVGFLNLFFFLSVRMTYGYANSAGANNGNLITFNSSATQIFLRSYTYDELNRLSTMSSPGGWPIH
jgi:hypothetical protein